MAHIGTDHCARIGVLFTHHVEPVQCELTFAVEDTSDAIFANPTTYSSDVFTEVVAHLVPQSTARMVYNGIVFEDVRSVPYVGADYPLASTPGSLTPTLADLPTDSALSIKRITGGVGRAARGRVYFPIWAADEMASADHVASVRAAQIVGALVDFQAAVESIVSGSHMVVISTELNGNPRSSGLAQAITAWGTPDLILDSQRRRLLGRGR